MDGACRASVTMRAPEAARPLTPNRICGLAGVAACGDDAKNGGCDLAPAPAARKGAAWRRRRVKVHESNSIASRVPYLSSRKRRSMAAA